LVCAAPTCDDGARNAAETGVDCGGPLCPKCSAGEGCKVDADCITAICADSICKPSCADGVKDGTESDVDCGGACPGCAVGGVCNAGSDCDSGVCTAGKCVDFVEALVRLGPVGATDQATLAGLHVDASGKAVIAANFGGKASFGGSTVHDAGSLGAGFAFARFDPAFSPLWDAGFAGGSVTALAATPTGEFTALGTYSTASIDFGNGQVITPGTGLENAFQVDFTATNVAGFATSRSQKGFPSGALRGMALSSGAFHVPVVVGAGKLGDYALGGTSVKNGQMFVIQLGVNGLTFSDGGNTDSFAGVAVDSAGNIVTAGRHNGSIDFGGGLVDSAASGEGFVLALKPTPLEYAWAKSFTAVPDGLAIDGSDNIILCGEFSGSVDFGQGPLTGTGGAVFLAKLDSKGAPLWAKAFPMGGTNPSVSTFVTTDTAGNILLDATVFSGTVDFGGGHRSGANIIAKLDPHGAHLWSAGFGESAQVTAMAAYDDKEILIGGTFKGTLAIGSGTPHTVSSVGGHLPGQPGDIFLAKLRLP
jgi:hypothetical protein